MQGNQDTIVGTKFPTCLSTDCLKIFALGRLAPILEKLLLFALDQSRDLIAVAAAGGCFGLTARLDSRRYVRTANI